MKRILILTILLMSSLAWAGSTTVVVGQGGGGEEAFCSTCTGDLVFCWGMTADSVDITASGGCTQGTDTTGSSDYLEAAPTGKTGYAIYSPSTYDTINFDRSGDDIFDDTQGTIQLDFYVTTWHALQSLFYVEAEANSDHFYIRLNGTDEVVVAHEGANAGISSAATSAANIQLETWYTLTVKWRTTDTDPNLYISCNGSTGTSNTNPTAFDDSDSGGGADIMIGNRYGGGASYVKNIKVWNTWQD